MPNHATVQVTPTTELTAYPARLEPLSFSAPLEFAEVLRVEHSCGILPSKAYAVIRNVSSVDETSGAICLNDGSVISEKQLRYYSRARVTHMGSSIFVGSLVKRFDCVEENYVRLEYWDDRHLLSKIPLRGCLVYDRVSQTVKLLTRYQPIVNPRGMRNCTAVQISGFPGTAFVFTELAEVGTEGQSSYSEIGAETNKQPGTALFWTPERFAIYLQLYALYGRAIATGDIQAAIPTLNTSKLTWPTLTFSGSDDFTTHKMAETPFTGQSALRALVTTLEVTGEYTLGVKFPRSANAVPSLVACATTSLSGDKANLDLETYGTATDIKTMAGASVEIDASEWHNLVVAEGQPPSLEGRLGYAQDASSAKDNVSQVTVNTHDALYPAWTASEELGFMMIVWQGKAADGSQILNSDGTKLTGGTMAALQLARITYPKVWRAFCLKAAEDTGGSIVLTPLNTLLDGFNEKFSGWPRIYGFKALMDAQLQPYYESRTAGKVARGRIRLDIRVEVTDLKASDSAGVYHDVTFNSGLRIDDDGLIWFDGLTDDITSADNIYTGVLRQTTTKEPSATTDSAYPKLRKIRLNAAVYHDTRVFAAKSISGVTTNSGGGTSSNDANKVGDRIDDSAKPQAGDGKDLFVRLVHNPEGFREEHQLTSYPCAPSAFQVTTPDGKGLQNLSLPLNKVLHSDDTELEAYAFRKLKAESKLGKKFNIPLIGIRTAPGGTWAGKYIGKVTMRPDATEYPLNGFCERCVFDFQAQQTRLIGANGA